MMKLHSLQISGFKSFVDTVSLRFSGGITAIVGPNGCGKSNLSDAITWVLGEQSAKSLRSATMEDVIFNGCATRKPVGMADVSLTLSSNTAHDFAKDGKLTLGRRVFRTGQSQYRLNGKVVRLKQIKDLLMDTGLGIRAYSVIEQGKIGMILSGKPQERRKLLEEAAGVTRYKARKRIAEVKLEEALGNLMRLDDIISEVERALRSLKRQANAARRYQEKEREYRDLLRKVLLGRWFLLREELDALDAQLADLLDRDAELAAALHGGEAEIAEGREHLEVLSTALAERHQEQADYAATIEGRQEFLKGSRQRLEEIAERVEHGRRRAIERRQQIHDFGHSLGELDERTERLISEREDAVQQVAEDDARIEAAQRDVSQAEARLESLRQETLKSVARLNEKRSQLQREEVEIERRTFRQRYLEEERVRLDRQVSEAQATLDTAGAKVREAEARLADLEAHGKKLADDLDALLRREAELSDERRQLENRLASQRQRQQILTELSEEHAERRRALIARLAEVGVERPRFLADEVRSAEGWEDAVDHFLGELADAVVLSDGDDALELARSLSRLGSSGVFLRPLAGEAPPAVEVEDPALAYSLAEALDLPRELERSLPPAFLVDDAADAERLAAAHPGIAFISRERLWARGGVLEIQGEEAAPGVLARSSELQEIGEEIPRLETRLGETAELLRTLVDQRTRHAGEINRINEEIAGERREIAVANARRQDVAARLEKLTASRQTVVDEQEEIRGELEAASAANQERAMALREDEEAHQALAEAFDRAEAEVTAAKERREALRTAGAGHRGRLELLDERLESHGQEAVRVRRQISDTEEQLRIWSEEEEALARRRRELELAMESAEEELQAALENRATAQEGVLTEQERLDHQRGTLRELERRVQELRQEREELRGRIETLRVEQAGLRQDGEHLAATYREEFKRLLPGTARPEPEQTELELGETAEVVDEGVVEEEPPEDSAETVDEGEAEAEGEGEDEEVNAEVAAEDEILEEEDELPPMERSRLAELEADLSRCKAVLERLGPVNVLAAKEYDEQQERHQFLTAQRADVADSVESLRTTIRDINETSSERFRQTFAEVNRQFGETFTRLFRGGEASMSLLDEEDVLESGIEITARPPGKRAQNIMLLSGGEKALTAIALLFALFQTKPSPFCILDEVDAPLDDVNVLRFVEVLKEMAKETQFLVVTHNKLTMEVASTLYGVTMEERGISKLVAVEVDDVQPEPQAALA